MFNNLPFLSSVTVQCTKTGEFIVVVAKDVTQPRIDIDTISLKGSGPNCHYIDSNSEFAIYHFNASDCGTTVSVRVQFPCCTNKQTNKNHLNIKTNIVQFCK